jgi:RNA polymerase sigma-70 factor (ECF subfamily)
VASSSSVSLPFLLPVGPADSVCYAPRVREKPESPLPSAALDHLDSLFRLARHLTGDDADAQDLVQETYARAYGAGLRFGVGSNVRAWLFRILRNLFIDAYRRHRNSPIGESLGDEESADDTVTREPLRGDAELERLRGAVAEDIEAALASLSEDARTVVLLDLEGLTETELAEVLGCSVGTVKSRLSRARAILRTRLCDYAR